MTHCVANAVPTRTVRGGNNRIVGGEVINLDDAPRGYGGEFDAGVPKKFVIDPHKLFRAA